jgi:hypothetical protein
MSNNGNFNPVTSECNEGKPEVIQPNPESSTSNVLNNVSHQQNQLNENAKYDTIDNDVKTGGSLKNNKNKNKNKYNITFKNKNYIIYDKNEELAIKNVLNNKQYKNENLLSINKNLYIIKSTKYNNIKKI